MAKKALRAFWATCVFVVVGTTGLLAVPRTSTPFTGTPIALPGTFQAANFDKGDPNVAYKDSTKGNTGGAYRQTDVDIEPNNSGFCDVSWIVAGEWLAYTVNVAEAGSYTFQFDGRDANGVVLPDGTYSVQITTSEPGQTTPTPLSLQATATVDGSTVVLSCPEVKAPVAVRYGMSYNPPLSLFNGAGLPAGPFHAQVSREAASKPATTTAPR